MISIVAAAVQMSQGYTQHIELTYQQGGPMYYYGQALLKGESVAVPAGFEAKSFHKITFAGAERPVVLGLVGGREAALIDLDGSGDVSKRDPARLIQREYETVSDPVALRWKINGRTVLAHYFLRGNGGKYRLIPAGAWTGVAELRGKKATVTVTDASATGDYQGMGCLRVTIDDDSYDLGHGGMLGEGGEFVSFEIDPRGAGLGIRTETPPTRTLTYLGETIRMYLKQGERMMMINGVDGKVLVPAADLSLVALDMSRKDAKNVTWRVMAADSEMKGVPLNQDLLDIEPILVVPDGRVNEGEWMFDLTAKTPKGLDIVGINRANANPPAPKLQLSSGGKEIDAPLFHYG